MTSRHDYEATRIHLESRILADLGDHEFSRYSSKQPRLVHSALCICGMLRRDGVTARGPNTEARPIRGNSMACDNAYESSLALVRLAKSLCHLVAFQRERCSRPVILAHLPQYSVNTSGLFANSATVTFHLSIFSLPQVFSVDLSKRVRSNTSPAASSSRGAGPLYRRPPGHAHGGAAQAIPRL